MAMNSLHRSQRFNIIWMFIWIIVYLALVFTSQPFLSMVNRGSLISIALVLCVIIFIVTGLVKAVSLYRLRRKFLMEIVWVQVQTGEKAPEYTQ